MFMKARLLTLLFWVSEKLRKRRIAKLLNHFNISEDTTILDVGGSGDWDWKSFGIEAAVTTLNLNSSSSKCLGRYIRGDACDMHMFADGEFDLVFSNSVIEHLPSCEHQQRMATEIRRVGKAYWVQTPNKHFPLELHLCFPFIQYFPVKWRISFAKVWPFSFEKMRNNQEGAIADAQVILLNRRQFAALFPQAEMICERFFGITKSLIVYDGATREEVY
jgi:hypothetical protein